MFKGRQNMSEATNLFQATEYGILALLRISISYYQVFVNDKFMVQNANIWNRWKQVVMGYHIGWEKKKDKSRGQSECLELPYSAQHSETQTY